MPHMCICVRRPQARPHLCCSMTNLPDLTWSGHSNDHQPHTVCFSLTGPPMSTISHTPETPQYDLHLYTVYVRCYAKDVQITEWWVATPPTAHYSRSAPALFYLHHVRPRRLLKVRKGSPVLLPDGLACPLARVHLRCGFELLGRRFWPLN